MDRYIDAISSRKWQLYGFTVLPLQWLWLLAPCKVTYFTQKWTQEKYLTPPAGEQVVLQKGERRFAREKKRYSGIFSMLCANFSKHEFFAMQILVTA